MDVKTNRSIGEVLASLEAQATFHREREAFHAEHEGCHRERRTAHAAELEEILRPPGGVPLGRGLFAVLSPITTRRFRPPEPEHLFCDEP